jgi:hypothetical protein
MSLDVYLTVQHAQPTEPRIYVRRNGANVAITRAEWDALCPGHEPLAVADVGETKEVYWANITHNLNRMADAAGIYEALWRPDEAGYAKAHQLIEPLTAGLERLRSQPATYRQYNPENGWGNYEGLVEFVEQYLAACIANPDADVGVWR